MSVSPLTVGMGTLRSSHQLHQIPSVRKVRFKGIKHLILISDGLIIIHLHKGPMIQTFQSFIHFIILLTNYYRDHNMFQVLFWAHYTLPYKQVKFQSKGTLSTGQCWLFAINYGFSDSFSPHCMIENLPLLLTYFNLSMP